MQCALHVKKYKLKSFNLLFMSVTIFAVLYFSDLNAKHANNLCMCSLNGKTCFKKLEKHCLEDKAFSRNKKYIFEVMETKRHEINSTCMCTRSLTENETTSNL